MASSGRSDYGGGDTYGGAAGDTYSSGRGVGSGMAESDKAAEVRGRFENDPNTSTGGGLGSDMGGSSGGRTGELYFQLVHYFTNANMHCFKTTLVALREVMVATRCLAVAWEDPRVQPGPTATTI